MSPRELQAEDVGKEELRDGKEEHVWEKQHYENDEKTYLIPTHKSTIGHRRREHWPILAKREVVEQSKTFLPALQSMILSKIPWFITLRILGEMDARNATEGGVELAAAALATTLCNVTGLSLCVGFSFALSTLAGQAKGELLSRSSFQSSSVFASKRENNEIPNTPVVFLLRGMIIQLLLVIPVGIWWLFGIDTFLINLGQTKALATHAATYLKILAPSLWVYSIQWTTTAWTQSIGMADVPATAALIGLILHIPFNLLFCYGFGLGYLGCAYATICFQTVQCLYIGIYLFVYPPGRERVLESTGGKSAGLKTLTFRKEFRIAYGSLRGFCDYLGLALPGIVVISEWWASECAIFLSGRLSPNPQTTLAAMTIYQSINSFCFMVPCGFAIAGTARVGNLLGAGKAENASLAGKVSVACCALCSGTIGWLLYTLPHGFLPSLFVSRDENPDIVDQTAATIPFLAIYVFADGVQTGLNGIIKGCGRQRIVVPIVVVAYWIVGVPLAYYLGLYRNGSDDTLCSHSTAGQHGDLILCGDVGLVAGMTAGTWCHMLLLAVVVVGTTDWKRESYRAKQRVVTDHERQKRKQALRQKKQAGTESDEDVESSKPLRVCQSDGELIL